MVGRGFNQAEKNTLTRGAEEQDLIYSGLEDTMIFAYEEIMEYLNTRKKVKTMRTAAYMSAIDKVATSYMQMGLFP